jgi:hypothetical protein
MHWVEQNPKTRITSVPNEQRTEQLNQAVGESLPAIHAEVATGVKGLEPISLKPFRCPEGKFEGEFGTKDGDLIFHFWPYGYYQAEHDGTALPAFDRIFTRKLLEEIFGQSFRPDRIEVLPEPGLGSICVLAKGYGGSQFQYELCFKAVEALYKRLASHG